MARARSTDRSPYGLIPKILKIIGVSVVAIFLIVTAFAQNLSSAFFRAGQYPAAYLANKSDGMVAGYLAGVLRDTGSSTPALGFARHALLHTPLSAAAVDTIAMLTPNQSAQKRDTLIRLGLQGGWRDVGFQTFLAKNALNRQDFAAAARHVDAAARVAEITPPVRTLLAQLSSTPGGRAQLARQLASQPRWRMVYLYDTEGSDAELRDRVEVLRAFQSTAAPATAEEKGKVLTQIARRFGLTQAYGYWKTLDQPDLSAGLYDPTFSAVRENDPDNMPFGWQLLPPVVGVDRGPGMADGKPGLGVSTDGTSTGQLVMQLVSLKPGVHRLRADGVFSTPNGASAFRWSVTCWSGQSPTGMLSPLSGSAIGSADMTFEVPADDQCPLQALTLSAQPARTPETAEGGYRRVQID